MRSMGGLGCFMGEWGGMDCGRMGGWVMGNCGDGLWGYEGDGGDGGMQGWSMGGEWTPVMGNLGEMGSACGGDGNGVWGMGKIPAGWVGGIGI